jgi:acetyl-CoA C-acetyltransferase
MEAVSEAAKSIAFGEGDLFLAGGTESMSSFPYAIRGDRSGKFLRNINTLHNNWLQLLAQDNIKVVDCIEEGLTDPVKHINMAQTAEVCAQKYGITRSEQDDYAATTFQRCLEAEKNGFYQSHTTPVNIADQALLKQDEYPFLRKRLAAQKKMFSKAPCLFDTAQHSIKDFYNDFEEFIGHQYQSNKKATVTIFNSCVRSDGAACIIVTTAAKAQELGLSPLAKIKSWGYLGHNPEYMGVAPAHAAKVALDKAQVKFNDLTNFEIHEAFAATVLSAFQVGKNDYNHNWQEKWKQGLVNPNGGSIPLGHPLAATGTRLILNLTYQMQQDKNAKLGMVAACASGGIGGAMVLEKI